MTTRKAKCPKCGGNDLKILNVIHSRDGMSVYRKRECGDCNNWISTEEVIEDRQPRLNQYERRLVTIYRKLNHNKRKALWAVLKFM